MMSVLLCTLVIVFLFGSTSATGLASCWSSIRSVWDLPGPKSMYVLCTQTHIDSFMTKIL